MRSHLTLRGGSSSILSGISSVDSRVAFEESVGSKLLVVDP
jgi:hypothetical protein